MKNKGKGSKCPECGSKEIYVEHGSGVGVGAGGKPVMSKTWRCKKCGHLFRIEK